MAPVADVIYLFFFTTNDEENKLEQGILTEGEGSVQLTSSLR
jgi:hypothetical protein